MSRPGAVTLITAVAKNAPQRLVAGRLALSLMHYHVHLCADANKDMVMSRDSGAKGKYIYFLNFTICFAALLPLYNRQFLWIPNTRPNENFGKTDTYMRDSICGAVNLSICIFGYRKRGQGSDSPPPTHHPACRIRSLLKL